MDFPELVSDRLNSSFYLISFRFQTFGPLYQEDGETCHPVALIDQFEKSTKGNNGAKSESEDRLSVLCRAHDLVFPCVNILVIHIVQERAQVFLRLLQKVVDVKG